MMKYEKNINFYGNKVFFLYPHSVIQNEMIIELIRNEYEIYIISDHEKIIPILRKYKDSILFINIDTILQEDEWEKYIKEIMQNNEIEGTKIGILTYNNDKALAEKYLMEILVPCGFIKLSLGIAASTNIIIKVLDANEVKGRRKYVRANCMNMSMTSFNAKIGEKYYTGKIMNISSAGMSCAFDENVDIELKTFIPDIQLKLKGVICKISGVIGGIRRSENTTYVILFDKKKSKETRFKISHFVFKCLQNAINAELEKIIVKK